MYRGLTLDGLPHGWGVFLDPAKPDLVRQGSFLEGKLNGFMFAIHPNGDHHCYEMKDDKPFGKSTSYSASGAISNSLYRDGKMIQESLKVVTNRNEALFGMRCSPGM